MSCIALLSTPTQWRQLQWDTRSQHPRLHSALLSLSLAITAFVRRSIGTLIAYRCIYIHIDIVCTNRATLKVGSPTRRTLTIIPMSIWIRMLNIRMHSLHDMFLTAYYITLPFLMYIFILHHNHNHHHHHQYTVIHKKSSALPSSAFLVTG